VDSGARTVDCPQVLRAAGKAYDQEPSRMLWEVSEQLTGIRYQFPKAPAPA
jgi:hypothetical protein